MLFTSETVTSLSLGPLNAYFYYLHFYLDLAQKQAFLGQNMISVT